MISIPPGHEIGGRAVIDGTIADLTNVPLSEVIGFHLEKKTRQALRLLIERYTTQTRNPLTGEIVLRLRCFVFSHEELQELLTRAHNQGREEEVRRQNLLYP